MNNLPKFLNAVLAFRGQYKDMTLVTAQTFLEIAIHNRDTPKYPGIPMKDLIENLDLPPATVSRNVSILAKWHYKGRRRNGLELVEIVPNIDDRRQNFVRLTPKGRDFLESIMRKMQ